MAAAPPPPPAAPAWPDELIAQQATAIGILSIPLLLEQRRWIHRQVDSIEFVDEARLQYRTSVDFTVPPLVPILAIASGALRVIPLALAKKGPFRHFDLR